MWQWLVENFMNGELFFYVIPLVLLVILIVVLFLPEADQEKKGSEKDVSSSPQVPDSSIRQEHERHDTISLGPIDGAGEEKGERTISTEAISSGPTIVVPPPVPSTYRESLARTRGTFFSRLLNIFRSTTVTDATIEEIEEALYSADVGVATVASLVSDLRANQSRFADGEAVRSFLKKRIRDILKRAEREFVIGEARPFVILMVGVNGAGKTTTMGKLAARFSAQGHRVLIVAADTFRAAATEQLSVWGDRAGVEVMTAEREGADPAAVAYRGVSKAVSEKIDIVMIDTAGRLQNRANLMEELRKIHRVIGKAAEGAPHEVLLVIDANNGQNAVSQAKEFEAAVGVTGIVVVKLDGTAKGGAMVGIAREISTPIYFTGIGETVADLKPFDADEFTEALFS